jgi:hypothetical protein
VSRRTFAAPEAGWLAIWQREHRYTDAIAAELLGLSVSSFRRQRGGRAKISRQTELLVGYVTVHEISWLDIAEIASRLARRVPSPVPAGARPVTRTERGP